MARQAVTDDLDNGIIVGWFDPDRAREFPEATDWDGSNHISRATGSQWDHQTLIRTAGGRWVLCHWSQWQHKLPRWHFISEDEARDWLIRNQHEEAVREYFPDTPDEDGPAVDLGGRPRIGGLTKVWLGDDVAEQIRDLAERQGCSVSELVRQAVGTWLEHHVVI